MRKKNVSLPRPQTQSAAVSGYSHFFSLVIVTAVVAVYFRFVLLGKGEMPGLDTPGHFAALKLLSERFQSGNFEWHIYSENWFGGAPLFILYSPLYFLVLAGMKWLLPFVSLEFLFRLSLFGGLCIFPAIFTFLSSVVVGKETRSLAPWMSLFYLFYPLQYSFQGIGAGSVVVTGLITNWYGLLLVMVWLGVLLLMKEKFTVRRFLSASLLLAAVITTHILSAVMAFGVLAYMGIFFWRERQFLYALALHAVLALLLSAWWLVPFLQYFHYSHTSPSTANLLERTVFFQLFPIVLIQIGEKVFRFISLPLLTVFCLSLYGLKNSASLFLKVLVILLYFVLSSDLLVTLFPQVSLHYQRFVSFLLVFLLLLATSAAQQIMTLGKENAQRKSLLKYGLLIALVVFTIVIFPLGISTGTSESQQQSAHTIQMPSEYPQTTLSEEYQNVLSVLRTQKHQRLFPQLDSTISMIELGSSHYISSTLPFAAKQPVINGLYAESASLTPYVMPLIFTMTKGETQSWGESKLRDTEYFMSQPFMYHFARLQSLGVDSVIVLNPELQKFIHVYLPAGSYTAKKFTTLEVFTLNTTPPLIESIPNFFVFISLGGEVQFSDLSQAVFAHPQAYAYPVVNGGSEIEPWSSRQSFITAFVVSAEKARVKQLQKLEGLSRPIILINPSQEAKDWAASRKNVSVISSFITLKNVNQLKDSTVAWEKLGQILVDLRMKESISQSPAPVSVKNYQYEQLDFVSSGPVLVRKGFAPDWKCQQKDCDVYEVSPSFLLVWGSGERTLIFQKTLLVTYARVLSLGVLVVCLSLFALEFRRKKV